MSRATDSRGLGSVGLWLGLAVVLQVGHMVAVTLTFGAPHLLAAVHDVAGWCAGLLAVFGTFAAVLSFERGDYLRKVWGGFAAGVGLTVIGTALRTWWLYTSPDIPFVESPLQPYRMVVVVLANIANTYGLVLLALTYRQSGLQPPPSARTNALWAVAGVLALAMGGPALVTGLRGLTAGGASVTVSVIAIASTLADMVTILLVVPILRVAYMLRGGRLAWVWWAMGLSGAAWLLYDARTWLPLVLPGDATHVVEVFRTLRTSGLMLVGLAGWLQRTALAPQQEPMADVALRASPGAN